MAQVVPLTASMVRLLAPAWVRWPALVRAQSVAPIPP